MRTRWLLTLPLMVAVLLGASPASAQSVYPLPTSGQGVVDRSTVRAGECVQFSGDGYAPGAVIDVTDNGDPRGTTTADAAGRYSTQVCFSTSAVLGAHLLSAQGEGENGALRTLSATVTVLGVATAGGTTSTGGSGALARTGGDIATVLGAGLALLLVGALLVAQTRRRRQTA
ncbi:MAG: hypothetical protein F2825_11660 [Actinobacteria bacterium]|uniref:Unannotated protein n=1 Tax=freshwater metagenome TaxID=449393 RepID=A0A6J7IW85_9ZZZZ|nr:hypothetical protein [Actinomycetota bacterium]